MGVLKGRYGDQSHLTLTTPHLDLAPVLPRHKEAEVARYADMDDHFWNIMSLFAIHPICRHNSNIPLLYAKKHSVCYCRMYPPLELD